MDREDWIGLVWILVCMWFILICEGCAVMPEKVQWHIELQARVDGEWEEVRQNVESIRIVVGKHRIYASSKCRHNVRLQKLVLDEKGVREFRFAVGPVIRGKFTPFKFFGTYQEAYDWHYKEVRYSGKEN